MKLRIDRREFLFNALATAGTLSFAISSGCYQRRGSEAQRKAAQFLWAQQSEDGGFHSSTYGLLRSGQSLTPFILDALLSAPDGASLQPRRGVERALEFIKANTNADGSLGLMDDSAADYPNYATSLAVSALVKARNLQNNGYDRVIERMVAHLREQQFSEASGWAPTDSPYGGWGIGGSIRRPPEAGHVDLSMTRYSIEALRLSGVQAQDTMARALVFLESSQNHDGGFYFSLVNL